MEVVTFEIGNKTYFYRCNDVSSGVSYVDDVFGVIPTVCAPAMKRNLLAKWPRNEKYVVVTAK